MMALARNIPQAANSMREGKWEKKKFQGTELFNKTLGIIGMGRIGTVVAERGLGLRMRVLCYDPFITQELAAKIGAESVSLDELLAVPTLSPSTPRRPRTRPSSWAEKPS